MAKRIYKSTFFLVFITLLLCIVLLASGLYEYSKERVFNILKQSTFYIEQAIKNEGISYLETLSHSGDRITLIDEDGKVIFDNYADVATMESHSDREEFVAALSQGEGRSIRTSLTSSQETLYYATKLADGKVLRVSATNKSVVALLKGLLHYIIFIFFISLCIAVVLSSKLVKYIMKPINQIDPDYPEAFETYEELSPLLSKLNDQNKKIKIHIAALQKKQDEFQNITENMSEGLIVVDAHKKIVSHNSSATKLLSDGTLGDNLSVFTFNRSEGFRKTIDAALVGERETGIIDVKGKHLQILANPVKEGNGVVGAILVIMDHTEQSEWENLRREFTANVSHELKTPLTSIVGIAEILKNNMVKQEDVIHFADNIHKEAQRMIALINDTIKLSELDEGAIGEEWKEIDLYVLTKDVCEHLMGAALSKNIIFDIKENHSIIKGVYQIVWDMIYNLVDNAIKYNQDNGRVEIKIYESDRYVEFRIIDTGIGIDDKDMERVFERFYRADKSHSKNIEGTGLGLSIVKHGAKFHNARVHLQSELQHGTTVTIEWPKFS